MLVIWHSKESKYFTKAFYPSSDHYNIYLEQTKKLHVSHHILYELITFNCKQLDRRVKKTRLKLYDLQIMIIKYQTQSHYTLKALKQKY